jgi:uncharacterized membrane protein
MRKATIYFVSSMIFLLFPIKTYAGLFFCNNSGEEIAVAVGWYQESQWVSKGWYRAQPRNCIATLLGVLTNTKYYYYAESTESNLSWGGDGQADAGYFCTTQQAFYLDSTNATSSTACEGHNFNRLFVGDAEQFTLTLSETQADPAAAAANCAAEASDGLDSFSKCWIRNVATDRQRRMLDCIDNTKSKASLAICLNRDNMDSKSYAIATCAEQYTNDQRGDNFLKCAAGETLSEDQARIFQCAVDNRGEYASMGACAIAGSLSPEQQRVFGCVADNMNDYVKAGVCAASTQLTPEQSRIASCVMNNTSSYMQMGVCSVGSNLTPEQQVFASCAISTGGQPYAFAGCVGTQLTMNELQKCVSEGIGGQGCFGDNNSAVKFVSNAWKDVTEGPGPSNDLLGQDGFVGRTLNNVGNDLQYGPGDNNDLVGRNGFVCNLFGGC